MAKIATGMQAGEQRHGASMPLEPGDNAPDFTLLDRSGEAVSLADREGRKVLVYFYPGAQRG